MKKILYSSLILLSTVALVGCGSNGEKKKETSKKNDTETVTAWAWDPTFNVKALDEANKIYSSDKKIEVVPSSQDDIVQKLNTALTAGNKEGLPSIVLIEDYKAQGFLGSYPEAFEDLSDIVDKKDFAEYKFGASTGKDGKIYGMPFDSGVSGLFYRTDLLKEAGLKDEDMTDISWKEYIEVGKKVKTKTGKNLLSLDPSDLGPIRIMMQSAGEWYTDKDGQVTIEKNKALKEGIQLYVQMLKEDVALSVSDWDSGVEALNTGKVVSAPSGSWYSSSIMQAKDQEGKWKIAPIPTLTTVDSVHASSIGGGSWYVLKGVGDTKKAKEFLKETFGSSKELTNVLVKEIGLVSTLKAAEETENYQAPNKFYSEQKVYEDFSEWMNEIPTVNYGKHTNEIEAIMTEFVQRAIGGEDLDALLKEAQSQVESTIN
ncbi:ABC transporter substrate-binding protein [Vagococcus sp.]|uniref:ABC transporter substrate-binding protein n=1 Tax=Vagococcus sp. TaxID=1933889 RepID=UPI003F9E56EB